MSSVSTRAIYAHTNACVCVCTAHSILPGFGTYSLNASCVRYFYKVLRMQWQLPHPFILLLGRRVDRNADKPTGQVPKFPRRHVTGSAMGPPDTAGLAEEELSGHPAKGPV